MQGCPSPPTIGTGILPCRPIKWIHLHLYEDPLYGKDGLARLGLQRSSSSNPPGVDLVCKSRGSLNVI